MNYCSHCGSESLSFEIPAGDNRPRYCCQNCERIHYQNPRVVVGTLPIYQNQILLCRRSIEPRAGYWNLPAGFLENGETVAEGAVRETWEEAKAKVDLIRVHAVYDIPHVYQLYIFFLAELAEPNFGVGAETLEVALFHPEEIPYPEMAFPSSTYAIRKYLENPNYQQVHLGGYRSGAKGER